MGKPAPGDEKALPMPSLQQTGPLSLLGVLIQQKFTAGDRPRKRKMLIHFDGSRKVHENKGNMDKITVKKSDIFGNMKRILQKNLGFDGQFTLIDTFVAGLVGRKPRSVIALPPRYNYAVPTGYEEVEQMVSINPLHGGCQAPGRDD